ncbi:MAG: ABC transporter substrate-binding protein [Thermoplasmata archaeon]|nr:ABC transporter substrate-binding protein [Thermoplasmata archaeon]MCI4353832.1 ABC transporter substrate-binding protein [Thermoplasmata archaeon]
MSLSGPAAIAPRAARSIPLSVFVVALLVVAGGAIAVTAAYYELRPVASPAGAVSITDDTGRVVAVPVDPARVVVLAPSVMDSISRLGLRSHVVGVDCGTPAFGGLLSDYNDSQIAQWNLSEAMCIETSPSVNIPQLLNFTPDLILASTITSVADVEEVSTTYHLPVVMLQPSTLGGVAVDVTLLGEIFGVADASERLVAQLQSALGDAQTRVANATASGAPLPTLLLTFYADSSAGPTPGFWTYGPNSFGQSLIEFLGAVSIASSAPFPYVELSGDQVLAAQPWGVIYGTGFGIDLSTYQQGPHWSDLTAVEQGRAWGIDSNLLTEPDPTMVLVTVPVMLQLLHPAA